MNRITTQGWLRSVAVGLVRTTLYSRLALVGLMCQGDSLSEGRRSWLVVGRDSKMSAERKGMLIKAALYAVQVFYSFFIM